MTAEEAIEGGEPAELVAPAYPISSVDRALRLLLMFRDAQELRLSDVSVSLGVAPSTAHRLLAMLIHHDFVRQNAGHGAYSAGPALLEIGYGAVRSMDVRGLADPILRRLARELDETVHLAQLEGGRIRYVAGMESPRPLRVADRTGQLFPAHRTATGKAILADLTQAQLDEVLVSSDLNGSSPEAVRGRTELEVELARVRVRGYSMNLRSDDDIVSLAVPVRNRRGLAVAAINASAPASRMTSTSRLDVVEAIHGAARRLGELLGDI